MTIQRTIRIETEQEVDGRWIAEAIDLPGVMVYGKTREDAIRLVQFLAVESDYDAALEMDLLLIKDLYGDGPDPANN